MGASPRSSCPVRYIARSIPAADSELRDPAQSPIASLEANASAIVRSWQQGRVAFAVLANPCGISDRRVRALPPFDFKLLRIAAVASASVEPMVGLAIYKTILKWGQP